MTADSKRLEEVLDTLGITDLRMPAGLDGQAVTSAYRRLLWCDLKAVGAVPAGRDFSRRRLRKSRCRLVSTLPLGEIGLRVLESEGHSPAVCAAIDWNTTLIVPSPTAQSFRQIEMEENRHRH